MEVWDPEDKPTVFCEIKKHVEALFLKKKTNNGGLGPKG